MKENEDQIRAKVSEMLTDPDFITDGSFHNCWGHDVEIVASSLKLMAAMMTADIEKLPLDIRQAVEDFRKPAFVELERVAAHKIPECLLCGAEWPIDAKKCPKCGCTVPF